MTLLLGMCGKDIVAVAADSAARKSAGPEPDDIKVLPLGGRFITARSGGNGSTLDPVRFDFSRWTPKSGEPVPLRVGASPSSFPHLDRTGESRWEVFMERFGAEVGELDSYEEVWSALMAYMERVFQAEQRIIRETGWSINPWTEWHWLAGFDNAGFTVIRQWQATGDADGVRVIADKELRHGRPGPDAYGWITGGSGQRFAAEWVARSRWGVMTQEDVMRMASECMTYSIRRSQETGIGDLGGNPRLVISKRGSGTESLILLDGWKPAAPTPEVRRPVVVRKPRWMF